MIGSFFDWFKSGLENQVQHHNRSAHTAELACAVLLVEVMRADHHLDEAEQACLKGVMASLFDLESEEHQALLNEATHHAENANDLQQFTRLVHDTLDDGQKFELLVGLWRVALVDQTLDKYEEHMIRKIADLLYIPHSAFIQAKQAAKNNTD